MRTFVGLIIALAIPTAALAASDCQVDTLNAEDLSIMASVRPVTEVAPSTLLARQAPKRILYSIPDSFGRNTEEDFSQIRSVQPEGAKVVLCTTSLPKI